MRSPTPLGLSRAAEAGGWSSQCSDGGELELGPGVPSETTVWNVCDDLVDALELCAFLLLLKDG